MALVRELTAIRLDFETASPLALKDAGTESLRCRSKDRVLCLGWCVGLGIALLAKHVARFRSMGRGSAHIGPSPSLDYNALWGNPKSHPGASSVAPALQIARPACRARRMMRAATLMPSTLSPRRLSRRSAARTAASRAPRASRDVKCTRTGAVDGRLRLTSPVQLTPLLLIGPPMLPTLEILIALLAVVAAVAVVAARLQIPPAILLVLAGVVLALSPACRRSNWRPSSCCCWSCRRSSTRPRWR